MTRQDFRATWSQALLTLFGPILLFLGVRWLIAEPFVIPSGSMIPTLHIHDHILVNKLAYGVHVPFSKSWLMHWSNPRRGDIIVFRYPENPDVFFVKRAIGLPGDKVTLQSGALRINDQVLNLERITPLATDADPAYEFFREEGHVVRYRDQFNAESEPITVPEGKLFVLGDNRDQSSDSRYWGFVPEENLVGRAWLIWMGCDDTLTSAQFLCDPTQLRWDRFFIRPK